MEKDNIIQFPRNNNPTERDSSFVFSVSVGVGCYRHIRVPVTATLENLSEIILCVFNFENDHAHAFFMDNRAWSQADCYYCEEADGQGTKRHTCDYRLYQVMAAGSKFKFVFDCGANWEFSCTVLRETEGIPQLEDDEEHEEGEFVFEILRIKGKAPEQYPDWDDE
ncbi:MAG: hypothetical protein Q4C01_06885 [Clostridia bacterium]|nr:hypothetical protein [Clostridia bacterium]